MELVFSPQGPFQTNCYVLTHENRAVVVDPGKGAAAWVEQVLNEKGAKLEKIVLTHGHIDHTRDAGQLAKAHGAPIFIHDDDLFMVSQPGGGVSGDTALLYEAATMEPLTQCESLTHGDTIDLLGLSFAIRHCPGHSPGSVLLVGDEVVFAGDVVFKGSIGRTDLPGSDPAKMRQSLRTEVLNLDDSLTLLPGHGPHTSMRAERRSNPFLNNLDAIG
ncbi:MBL fold metallo-hydrolase [Corynebacterium aquilae]|uniref:Metallo-beta-lactamase domain-containing protein n=1 Tax=Corynebacterium aquilae DSM 44791 TaxID=1431546 RepID=A0A1L7CGB4_9CORY|nr:MBL fold metallo-hydrolase [Corynebacterium aquilae]APT84864.1 hypothetical protein CAQU_07030 [Corynebacterium aquilae DSM 44791]